MGELSVKNLDPRLGSLKWADWTNRGSNQPLIKQQLSVLIPNQEMLPFQRQVLTREMLRSVPQGDNVLYEATVPQDQAWRLIWMTYRHVDNIFHILNFRVLPMLPNATIFHTITRRQVQNDTDTPLYPSMPVVATDDTQFDHRGGPRPEFFPGDKLSVLDETSMSKVGSTTCKLIFRYERIPLPVSQTIDNVWTAQTF